MWFGTFFQVDEKSTKEVEPTGGVFNALAPVRASAKRPLTKRFPLPGAVCGGFWVLADGRFGLRVRLV